MTHSIRRQIRWSFGLLLVAILLANESITRGHVFDAEGRPLAGADVLLADSSGVYAIGRSDDRGYFRLAHRPFGRLRKSLLICANRNTVHVSPQATSAIIRSSYTIGAEESRFPTTPADLGWPAEVPPSCPSRPVPRATLHLPALHASGFLAGKLHVLRTSSRLDGRPPQAS